MERIAVLLPSSDSAATAVREDHAEEYEAIRAHELFYPVLYNLSHFIQGEDLAVSMRAPAKSQYCIVRSMPADYEKCDALTHSLKRKGYHPAFRHVGGSRRPRLNSWYQPDNSGIYLKQAHPYGRYKIPYGNDNYQWRSSPKLFDSVCPAVAKDHSRVLRDESGEVAIFEKPITGEDVDRAVCRFSNAELSSYDGTMLHAPMYFEQWVLIAKHGGVPVEWRVFHYLGRTVYLCPKHPLPDGARLPEPPQGVLQTLRLWDSGFSFADFALTVSGEWKVLKEGEGESARLPEGGSAEEFYRRLAEEIERGPYMPGWTWCLVGDIVESHALGESGRVVPGTRHFAPGAKVYFLGAFWGMGGERCTVLGVPKYCDHLVGVTMKTEHIENLRVEKVYDEAVIKAIWTNRLGEEFERYRRTSLTSRWGNTEMDWREIQDLADMLNGQKTEKRT